MIEVELQNTNNFSTVPNKSALQNWSNAALQKTDSSGSMSLVIRVVNEEEGIALNLAYRDKNSATNILSFPYEVPEYATDIPELEEEYARAYLGDLVLCEKVVINEAKAQNKTLEQHWAHLIVHGVLHLQGYNHIDDGDALIMESLEIRIMESLGFDNPYLETTS